MTASDNRPSISGSCSADRGGYRGLVKPCPEAQSSVCRKHRVRAIR
jgi:hypothetical protein